MPTLDIFTQDAFSLRSLTAAINSRKYVPGFLGRLGLFQAKLIATRSLFIEEQPDTLSLIGTTPLGGSPPLLNHTAHKRTVRPFETMNLVKADLIMADEIQGVRAFGSESETQVIGQIVMDRFDRLMRDLDLTMEHHRLGCIKGTLTDANGDTIYNLFTQFNVSQESEVDFDLDNALATAESGAVRQVCTTVCRTIRRNCGGGEPTEIIGLCGDTFWDNLVNHPEVRGTYLNHAAAADLRGGVAWGELTYGGIRFVNYRGTDDGTTLGVHTDKVHLFPLGVPDLFVMHYAPAPYIEDRPNYLGAPFYAYQSPDTDTPKKFVKLQIQSNPLPLCTRPKVLMLGKRT